MPVAPELTPETWLCAALDMANGRSTDKVFRVVKLNDDVVQVLHRDSGAVWEFKCSVIRQPVDKR